MRGADAGRRRMKLVENWLQHKSLHVFAHMRSLSIDGAGTKSISQQMGRTPIFPCPLPNLTPQNQLLPSQTWQIHSRRSTIHLPLCEQGHGSAAGISKPACVGPATTSHMCEHTFTTFMWTEF